MVCDDRGVEFSLASSAWTLESVHYASPALERVSQYEPCGFGSGKWDGMGWDRFSGGDMCVCVCVFGSGGWDGMDGWMDGWMVLCGRGVRGITTKLNQTNKLN